MTTADKAKIKIVVNGKEVEEVDSFTFLGSTMDRDGECTPEIKRRMAMGRRAMVGMAPNIEKQGHQTLPPNVD